MNSNEPKYTRKLNPRAHSPPDNRPSRPQAGLRFARGVGVALVKPRLARRPVTPSGEVPPRSEAGRPLERGPASLEGWTPPRARTRLDRELNAPLSKAPPRSRTSRARRLYTCSPAGAFNALTRAGARVKGESTPRRTWESRSGTAPPTPRRCATLCGMVSNHPVVLYHPLPYGRRTAPSRKDDGTLEGKTHDYSTPAWDGAVTSGQWERSPPSPSALCDHPRHHDAIPATASPYPTLWKHAVTGHRHDGHYAPYGPTTMAPSSPHTGSPRTGNLYTATLEAAPGHAQDAPRRPSRSGIRQDDRLLHGIVRHASTRS
jgi:hypothetical protein